jgi:glycolate dehydrogenase FAD-binding subunit
VTATLMNPTDLRGVRDAVLDSAGALAVAGAGTAAGWAGTLGPVDAVLDLRALAGVITHNPGDMTVSVRAGTPLRELNAELAGHGQHVALDAARVADGATVGGLLSTGDAGPGALVHGSLRDLVIGATLVLADGTVARTGGHVIKNVAGYDLAKLVHGAYGTLAVIAEVVLRLHPLPHATATLVLPCPLQEAAEHAARILGGPYEPAALEWVSAKASSNPDRVLARHGGVKMSSDPGALLVRVEGTEAALPERIERLRELLGSTASVAAEGSGAAGTPTPTTPDTDLDAGDPWAGHTRLTRGTLDDAVLRIGVRPSRLPGVLAKLDARGVAAGLGTGVATVVLPADPAAVAAAHAAVHAAGGTSVLRSRPVGLDASAWGPAPSALAVLRAVKQELDPAGRLGPGRLAPWLTEGAS